MTHETIVILKTLPHYLPLYWVAWTWHGTWPASAEARCRLFKPQDHAHKQRLREVFFGNEPVACMLHDPRRHKWYAFDASLTAYAMGEEPEVTLRSSGPMREADDAIPAPRPHRKQRKDAGRPRTPRKTPLVTGAKE